MANYVRCADCEASCVQHCAIDSHYSRSGPKSGARRRTSSKHLNKTNTCSSLCEGFCPIRIDQGTLQTQLAEVIELLASAASRVHGPSFYVCHFPATRLCKSWKGDICCRFFAPTFPLLNPAATRHWDREWDLNPCHWECRPAVRQVREATCTMRRVPVAPLHCGDP